jgi:adenosine kinase
MDFAGRFADRIMPEKIHALSLSFLVDTLSKQFGGTAGNIAYTLKLLGVEPFVLSPAGNDFAPYKKFLQKHKITTKYIAVHDSVSTGAYFVMTDQKSNQIGSFFLGATKYAKDLKVANVKTKPSLVILAPTEPKAMIAYAKECRAKKLPYMYDPAFQIGNFTPEELREAIEGAHILIGNDYEIALIEQKLEISHEELIVMVPVLITTMGIKGSIIETRNDAMHVKPANPVDSSDPTGAGDAYRAGFIAGYLQGFDLQVCGQMGSVAAVYTVEKYGTQTHEFTKKEFIARYKANFGSVIRL